MSPIEIRVGSSYIGPGGDRYSVLELTHLDGRTLVKWSRQPNAGGAPKPEQGVCALSAFAAGMTTAQEEKS